jgi:REP element-mobilizing transposase RayT/lambda repressor-like predicted transcriptional regulator
MPRKSRIDAPGALHHIIVRGIAGTRIFADNTDRDRFLDRFGGILSDTATQCYAWALMPNHAHLLLRTAATPISTLLRRLLTGYAVNFNRRHARQGHLFQNRYKSILCQEEPYLLELVRYIHLNPIRAGTVKGLDCLESYRYAGHGVILGKNQHEWQDANKILKLFAERVSTARRRYREFVAKAINQGRRPELVGGGLVRSAGGWTAVKALRRAGSFQQGDERILGDGDFVEEILSATNEALERRYHLKNQGFDLDRVANRVAALVGMHVDEIWAPGKLNRRVQARSLLCFWCVRELGTSMASLARKLNLSVPAVSKAVVRGEKIASRRGWSLMNQS